MAHALAGARPAPGALAFDGVAASSPWPRLLGESWPGRRRARVHTAHAPPAPTVSLTADSLDTWLAGKSANFRGQVRRLRRHLHARGASFVRVDPCGDVEAALSDLARLHHARWKGRGGSGVLDERVESALVLAARDLAPRGRFWISTIVAEDRVISAHLAVTTGSEIVYWLGGHDDAWAHQKPGVQALVALVQMGLEGGDRDRDGGGRLQLGPGAQHYKQRLADGEEMLALATVAPHGPGWLRTRSSLAAEELGRAFVLRLTDEHRRRARRLLGRR